jgi:hypothetical protein
MENKGLLSDGISATNQPAIHLKSILPEENTRCVIYEFKLLHGVPSSVVAG